MHVCGQNMHMLHRNLAAARVATAPQRRPLAKRKAPEAAKGHTLKIDASYYGQITGQETQELGGPVSLLQTECFDLLWRCCSAATSPLITPWK